MKDYLPSQEEISSTEKLLDLIRGESVSSPGEPSADPPAPPPSSAKKVGKPSRGGFFSLRKRINIGVDIGHTHLRMVKVARTSEHRWRLLDYRSVPYRAANFEKSPQFAQFLKSSLADFGASSRNVSLWTIMSSAQADVRHIRIPKVAKRHIFDAVYWTAKKELQFDDKETLFDFEVQGDTVEKGITKAAVAVYTLPRQELKKVTDLFSASGLRPAGATIAPFANQNLFRTRWIPQPVPVVASLYVGSSFSRIDIISGGNLVMTRGIKTGAGSMIEAILETYNEGKNQISIEMGDGGQLSVPLPVQEQRTMDEVDAGRVFSAFANSSESADAQLDSFYLSRPGVMDMIRPALERLVRQMERTFEHYLSVPGNDPVGKIYISGMVASCPDILDFIGQQLGIEKGVLDPLDPDLAVQSDVLPPDSVSERAAFTAALGLALADNALTPNGLFTYKDKARLERAAWINRGILMTFVAVMCGLLGVFFWLGHVSASNQTKIARLREELSRYGPAVDQNMLLMFAGKVKTQLELEKQKSQRDLGMGVLSELSNLTPSGIRLVNVKADFGPLEAPAPKAKSPGQPPAQTRAKSVFIEGIVEGERQTLESVLARYLMKLGSSPLFKDPAIQNQSFENLESEGQVLRFTLNLGLN